MTKKRSKKFKISILIFIGILIPSLIIFYFSTSKTKNKKIREKLKISQTKLVNTGIIPWQKKELRQLLIKEQIFINSINNNPDLAFSELRSTLNQINQFLLKNQSFLGNYYKNKFPNITKQLENLSRILIETKTELVIKAFRNTIKASLTDFNNQNQKAITNFYTNLSTYFNNVKKLNSEVFINSLFSYKNLIKYIKSKDKETFLENLYTTYFLSESMIEDAIQTFIKEYEDNLYANQVNFLNQITRNFTQYISSMNDIAFIPDLSKLPEDIQISSYQLPTKNLLFIDKEIINRINSVEKRVIATEGIDIILTFTPLSPLADGSTFLYEKKLHDELERTITDAINSQTKYIWTIFSYRLNKLTQDFSNKTLHFTFDTLSKQYKSINIYTLIGEKE